MSRPTPEEIILDLDTTIHPGSPRAISDYVAHAEVPDIIPALEAAGYRIIHPDDVPKSIRVIGMKGGDMYCEGWNACRTHIFGEGT